MCGDKCMWGGGGIGLVVQEETKACLMVQQCEWACLCQCVDIERRAVVGKATPEVLIPCVCLCVCICVCVCVCYTGLSSWAQRACPWQRAHRHNTLLCWNRVLCKKAKLRGLEVGDKWATVERAKQERKWDIFWEGDEETWREECTNEMQVGKQIKPERIIREI